MAAYYALRHKELVQRSAETKTIHKIQFRTMGGEEMQKLSHVEV
jgi:hypothetical protein